MTHVFISYVREDKHEIDRIVDDLKARRVKVWVDRERIGPGERWEIKIRTAIERGASFLACFSSAFFNRDRSYMNEELHLAIDELRKRPIERKWFIPVRLSDCSLPEIPIGSGQTLAAIQCVDLFADWDAGIESLSRCLCESNRLQRSTGTLEGLAFDEETCYMNSLANAFKKYGISLRIVDQEYDACRALSDMSGDLDFFLLDPCTSESSVIGGPRDEMGGLELIRYARMKLPELAIAVLCPAIQRYRDIEIVHKSKCLVKSMELDPEQMAYELNNEIRRLMKSTAT